MRGVIVAIACVACSGGKPATPTDSRSGDGGAIDAAVDAGRDLSTDRGKFFGASRCAAANVALCEDFESGALDGSTWKTAGTAPTIDTAQAARGSHAMHVHLFANGASYIKETKTFPT